MSDVETQSAEGAETKPEAITTPPAETKETKPTESAPPAAAKEEPKEPVKPVVPEKYDLKLSEDSFLDAALVERIATIARERGLSNEQAQAFLNDQNKAVGEAYDAQSKAWVEQLKNDKEIGGEGFKQNAELAKNVVNRYGSDSLKKELNKTGYGNHPELVRLLSKIGKAMSPDQLVLPGSQAGGGKRDMETVFYGTTKET